MNSLGFVIVFFLRWFGIKSLQSTKIYLFKFFFLCVLVLKLYRKYFMSSLVKFSKFYTAYNVLTLTSVIFENRQPTYIAELEL